MAHPQIDSMPVVVAVIHQLMELKIQIGMLRLVGKIQLFDLCLERSNASMSALVTMPTNQRVNAGSISTSISQISRTNSSSIGRTRARDSAS